MTSLSKNNAQASYVFEPAGLVANALRGKVKGLGAPTPEEQAAAVLEAAQTQADSIRQSAYEEGFNTGLQNSTKQWQSALDNLLKQRQSLQEAYGQCVADIEPQALKLALEIAAKIVAHEVEQAPDTVLDVLRLALRQLKARDGVRIWVNQSDLEMVRSARKDLADWAEGLREVEIGEDRRVGRGGVLIESSDGILDARPASQIQEITRRLQEAA